MGKAIEKVNPERKRTRFTKEFKLEAVKLLEAGQKPATQLALELGIRRNQLHKWQAQLRRKGADEAFRGPGAKPLAEFSEVERLRRELKRDGRARHFKKSRCVLCEGTIVKYAFIRDHRKRYSATRLCELLDVSKSGFHAWLNRPVSAHAQADQRLLVEIRRVHLEYRHAYGGVKTWHTLRESVNVALCGAPATRAPH